MSETYTKLIDRGLQLFLQQGFTASGISRIVGAAGVPKGSFYHFFPGGKESFALAVIARYHEVCSRDREQTLLTQGDPPLVRLRQHFASFAQGFSDAGFQHGCLLGNLSAEIADQMPNVRTALQRAFDAWAVDVATVIAHAQASGAMDEKLDPAATARSMIASWEGALLLMKSHQSGDALDDFLHLWFEHVLIAKTASS